MTEGILLRLLAADGNKCLDEYDVVVLDEVGPMARTQHARHARTCGLRPRPSSPVCLCMQAAAQRLCQVSRPVPTTWTACWPRLAYMRDTPAAQTAAVAMALCLACVCVCVAAGA